MKIQVEGKPPIIIGARVAIGQAIMGTLNAGVFLWNYMNPEQTIPGEIVGFIGQPIIFLIQVWYANRYGVTQ